MAAPLIDVGAPGDTRCHRAHKSRIAFHKAPNIIAVPPVPFGPAITRKVTDLVCARCIPGFSDYLGVRQHVGQLDSPDYGADTAPAHRTDLVRGWILHQSGTHQHAYHGPRIPGIRRSAFRRSGDYS